MKQEQVKQKENEYYRYVQEHISNVKKCFNELVGIIELNDDCGNIKCGRWFNASVHNSRIIHNAISKHDVSKLSTEEFDGYRQFFYPVDGDKKDRNVFDKAWEHHFRNNPHHWEFWIGGYMGFL